ncbi:MAG: A/G-specific adenine glycosylase [Porticoccaceae bacterium]|jgi:A/G-specific adenine glycosylase
MKAAEFQKAVLNWFDQHGRTHLPWQQNTSAYRVWVSEIMLQQTQVSTVIPYYLRFMESFPSVKELAAAPLDEILHHWTGLGYYARARNLHRTAQQVSKELNGNFPSTVEQLSQLPGIGRSTAGAISAIAFHQQAAILDGNVKRVLARFGAISGWPGKAIVVDALWTLAENNTPHHRIADYTQAMMDLGATLCTRSSPNCPACPLRKKCLAYKQGNPQDYPGKKPKKTIPIRNTCFLMIRNDKGELLLRQNPPTGLWGGLWVFPQCDTAGCIDQALEELGVNAQGYSVLDAKRHTFSHFHLDYHPIEVNVGAAEVFQDRVCEKDNQVWYNPQKPISLGMPAPIKALFNELNP